MKNIALLAFLLFTICVKSFGQDGDESSVSISPQIALAVGDYKKTHGLGIGGSFNYQVPVLKKVRLVGTVEGISFFGKEIESAFGYTEDAPFIGLMSLKGGVKLFLFKGLFTMGQLGYGYSYIGKGGEGNFGLAYSGILGYGFENTSLSFKYSGNRLIKGTFNSIGFSIGYGF